MKIQFSSSVDPVAWDGSLKAFNAPLFHSTDWARYSVAGQANLEPFYCRAEDGSGLILLFRHAARNPLLKRFTRMLYSDAHPAVLGNHPVLLEQFTMALEESAGEAGAVQLTIGSFGTPGARDVYERLGYQLKDRFEFFLRLDRTEDEIWAGMEYKRRKHFRNALRKAEKMGVVIEELPAREGSAALRHLQQATSERIEKRGVEVGFRLETGGENDPMSILIQAGRGRIVGARYQDEIVSAGFFTEMNGMAYYTVAGHSPAAYECQAPSYLLWQTILHYKNAGASVFNFGGVPFSASLPGDPENGLFTYKEQFGGAVELCTTASKILKPSQHLVLQKVKQALSRT